MGASDDVYADVGLLAAKATRLRVQREALIARRDALVEDVAALTREAVVLAVTKTALEHLLQRVQAENLTRIEQLVTYGLGVVFPERALSLKATALSKRGVPWVDLTLVSAGAHEAPVLKAFGGGPASVIAFLLRTLAIRRAKLAPLMLLDESFSFVSADYVPAVGALLRELAEKAGMTILLVTHQPEFLRHATRAYRIVEGPSGSVFEEVRGGKQ